MLAGEARDKVGAGIVRLTQKLAVGIAVIRGTDAHAVVEAVFEIQTEPTQYRRAAEVFAITAAVCSDRETRRDHHLLAPVRCNPESPVAVNAAVRSEAGADKRPQLHQRNCPKRYSLPNAVARLVFLIGSKPPTSRAR